MNLFIIIVKWLFGIVVLLITIPAMIPFIVLHYFMKVFGLYERKVY